MSRYSDITTLIYNVSNNWIGEGITAVSFRPDGTIKVTLDPDSFFGRYSTYSSEDNGKRYRFYITHADILVQTHLPTGEVLTERLTKQIKGIKWHKAVDEATRFKEGYYDIDVLGAALNKMGVKNVQIISAKEIPAATIGSHRVTFCVPGLLRIDRHVDYNRNADTDVHVVRQMLSEIIRYTMLDIRLPPWPVSPDQKKSLLFTQIDAIDWEKAVRGLVDDRFGKGELVEDGRIVEETLEKLGVEGVVVGEVEENKVSMLKCHNMHFMFLGKVCSSITYRRHNDGIPNSLCFTNIGACYSVLHKIYEWFRPNVEFAEFPVRSSPPVTPKRKLWPSIAERVDAVNWGKVRKLDVPDSASQINWVLRELGFPEITTEYVVARRTVVVFRSIQDGRVKGTPCSTFIFDSEPTTYTICRRILEAVKGWSLTDTEGGGE